LSEDATRYAIHHAKIIPLVRRTRRNGRGPLRGKPVPADASDRTEPNETIARDFGLLP
jgi:hypothetical protein